MISTILLAIGVLLFLFIGTVILIALIEAGASMVIDDEETKRIVLGTALLFLLAVYFTTAGLYLS